MLSPYSKQSLEALNRKQNFKEKKLTATFNDRIKYVIHGVNLQTYLRLGMKLEKVHKLFSFKQAEYIKKYIDFCTLKRSLSKTKFEKDQYKLFANAVFGKFLEDVTKHLDCKVCFTEQSFKKASGLPNFHGFITINKNYVLALMKKRIAIINRPYLTGFTILEISKNYMYKSYYDHFTEYFDNPRVLFSDTDSFMLAINTSNKIKSLSNANSMMDFSNYEKTHPLYNCDRQNKLGYFKDEMCGNDICEFVGIRSKTYAIKSLNKQKNLLDKKICKGIKKML